MQHLFMLNLLYKDNKFKELIKVESMLDNLAPGKKYENDILWTKIYLGVALLILTEC